MATATAEKKAPANPFTPANWDEHQSELALRREARKANRDELQRCLDPDAAASLESRKPLYEWTISCEFSRPDGKGGKMKKYQFKETVTAQTEADAWAKFCDTIEAWPGPHSCTREIVRGKKIN